MYIVGDNLGSNYIGGFVENFSSGTNYSRFCRTTGLLFNEVPYMLRSERRTVENYNFEIDNLKNLSGSEIHVNGVKRNSIFNSLDYFHV